MIVEDMLGAEAGCRVGRSNFHYLENLWQKAVSRSEVVVLLSGDSVDLSERLIMGKVVANGR